MKFNPREAINNLEYNTNRSDLVIPEYGRHLQKLIDQVIVIPEREERNRAARAIIDIMGTINPHLRDVLDFQHKLWDQLFKMSGFQLDVDSPYPKPQPNLDRSKPILIDYPTNNHKYRFYGTHIIEMINEAISWEEGERKNALIMVIANHMKKSYVNWNKDNVTDDVIFTHLLELSKGKINLFDQSEDGSSSVNLMKQSARVNQFQNRNTTANKNQFQNRTNSSNTQKNSQSNSGSSYSNNTNNQKRFVKKNTPNTQTKPTNRKTN